MGGEGIGVSFFRISIDILNNMADEYFVLYSL